MSTEAVRMTLDVLYEERQIHESRMEDLARDLRDDPFAAFLAERLDEEAWEAEALEHEIEDAELRAVAESITEFEE